MGWRKLQPQLQSHDSSSNEIYTGSYNERLLQCLLQRLLQHLRPALTVQFTRETDGVLSISVLCGLSQSYFRLRGSVSVFGDSQIPSAVATQQLDILRNTS